MDETCPIELESRDRRTTSRSQAHDRCEIIAPRKMVAPTVLTWMKQEYRHIGNRINRPRLDCLVSIAALAGESKIVSDGRTTRLAWEDMLNNQRLRRIFGRTTAVFAVSSRTFRNESSQNGWNIPLSHDRENARGVGTSPRPTSRRGVVPRWPVPPCGQRAGLPVDP